MGISMSKTTILAVKFVASVIGAESGHRTVPTATCTGSIDMSCRVAFVPAIAHVTSSSSTSRAGQESRKG
jgi:hypothetical protein